MIRRGRIGATASCELGQDSATASCELGQGSATASCEIGQDSATASCELGRWDRKYLRKVGWRAMTDYPQIIICGYASIQVPQCTVYSVVCIVHSAACIFLRVLVHSHYTLCPRASTVAVCRSPSHRCSSHLRWRAASHRLALASKERGQSTIVVA